VYLGVAWLLEDHKVRYFLPAFKDVLSGDGVIDKGYLGFESFYGVIGQTSYFCGSSICGVRGGVHLGWWLLPRSKLSSFPPTPPW
jgi:hypothetical protein